MYNYLVHVRTEATMPAKTIGAAQFKAECLRLIDEMSRDPSPVTITKRGRPVATLAPVLAPVARSPIGALKGSVLRFDDPFSPATDPADWNASS